MAGKSNSWIGGTAVVAIAIAAGAWFVAIHPTLASAADQRQAASDQRNHNTVLQAQIAKLKSEFDHLGDYKDQLSQLRQKVPQTADLAALTREIQSVGDSTGVTLMVDAPGTPTALVVPEPAAAKPQPSATASASPAATGTTGGAAGASQTTASGQSTVDGLFQIPLSVTVVGTYDQTVAFLDGLQQAMPRLYVIDELNATSLEPGGASGGRPAVKAGDLETVVTGYVLTMQAAAGAAPQPKPGATATPTPTQLPVPSGQRNPFQPVNS
jgi:Tfp pilus assembly protein PilO